MQIDDAEYLVRRAKQEREIAATCEDNAVALAHLKMADEYQRRLDALRARPPADSVEIRAQTF